ncbi:hypothetical protein SD37_23120 [Amycolatopsis orientalis]|uniref:Uncharacterized protein n=1 Tax=Amycolatopsis orientalis TaxID=31958 RepID=A0A193C153_AMYOR|nr:hypothetical protein [Amycolatopsis orientalis]ANN18246.1 hypothetical protein SD37_23120 [Amycolatopsis orientalis]
MESGIRVSVESAEPALAGTVVCVVRCLGGPVSVGDVFELATLEHDADAPIDLRVTSIQRYDHAVDSLEPPHTAKLELKGQGMSLLARARELRGSAGAGHAGFCRWSGS